MQWTLRSSEQLENGSIQQNGVGARPAAGAWTTRPGDGGGDDDDVSGRRRKLRPIGDDDATWRISGRRSTPSPRHAPGLATSASETRPSTSTATAKKLFRCGGRHSHQSAAPASTHTRNRRRDGWTVSVCSVCRTTTSTGRFVGGERPSDLVE